VKEVLLKFFDYEKLYTEANGDCDRMIELFNKSPSLGPNFIVNPHPVRVKVGYSNKALAEYLGLCALRRYENYVYTKEVDLESYLIPPWIPRDVIENNPLVKLTDTKLIFKKETNTWL
jgi:hypothetical protein